MKAIEVLSLLNLYDVLPRGLNVCDGDIFASAMNRYPKSFISMKGNFESNKMYIEIRQQAVSAWLWNSIERCDAEVEFTFGTYRYLVVE